MDSRFKAFRDGIGGIISGILFIPLTLLILSNSIHTGNIINVALVGVFFASIGIASLLRGIWKFKQNRIPFKKDRRTKILTITELVTGIVSLCLLLAAAFFQISCYFSFEGIMCMLGGLVVCIVFIIMVYDFLPEQVADEGPIASPQAV
jgi:hypothetical protein